MNRLFAVTWVVLAASLLMPECRAQNNNAKSAQVKRDDQKVQHEEQDVKQAQDNLKHDQTELHDAEKALAHAEGKEKDARKKLDEVRKHAESKYEKSSGIDKAMSEQDAAKKSYDEVAAPILKTLKESKGYQAAQKKVEDAKARLTSLREDKSLSAEARQKGIGKASQEALAVSELETKTLEDDSKAKPARQKLAAAQQRVNELRAKIRGELDNDSDVKSALGAMRESADAHEAAGKKLAKLREKLGGDQAKLNREQQQLKQAEVNKMNDSKNTTNHKKPNNKGKK